MTEMNQPSDKSYATAVCLSAVFGLLGIQHFYLSRYLEGFADVAMTAGWLYSFTNGYPLLGLVFLAADGIHSFIVTIMLLTGSFKDGKGHIVCYPGQVLK